MVSFSTSMNGMVAGQISRVPSSAVIETVLLASTNAPSAFGTFLVTNVSNQERAFLSGDTAASISGLLVLSYPTQSTSNTFGVGTPVAGKIANRLRRGYCGVTVAWGTPALDGQVYIRLDTGGNGGTVGQIEATADSTHNAAVPGARWAGSGLYSGNVAEVAYNM